MSSEPDLPEFLHPIRMGEGSPLLQCSICGALTTTAGLHARWHKA